MSHNDAFRNHNSSSRPSRPLPQHVVMNPFRGSPTSWTGATHPANGTSSIMGKHAARADGTVSRAKVSSISSSEATRSALPRMSATDTASSTNATTYTGAAILGSYTNRRKLLQKASALSSQMHRQVDDVVQMEEEQRLLSQAFRSRQKLQEQEQEQAQQQQRMATAKSGSPMQVSVLAEAAGDGEEAEEAATSHRDGDPLSSAARANTDSYGVVLDGTPDTKRLLQQQAHEKNEMLGKMRGMQLAIQELSAEAAADEERWFAHSRYHGAAATTTEAQSDNGGRILATTNTDNNNNNNRSSSGGNTTTEEPTVAQSRGAAPPDVLSKLDAIRDLRTALKDMMDAHRPHAADRGSYGSSGSGVNGATWVELDAAYNPPAPPQVFSTNALAVTLEYVSDSMASIARIADEFCVATTFRARSDRLSLLPHLKSLQKWTAQAERSLDTTQRHLRHFQVGETAVLDGGAFEVNSLREQTLLLKESLTAQDQKVKSTEEARMAVLHRLREVRRRCRMWEVRLLHRASGVRDSNEAKLRETPVFYSLANARPNRSTASLSTDSSNVASPRKGNDDSAQETDVPRTDDDHGGVDASGATNKSDRPASSTFLQQASTDGVEKRAAAASESGRQRSAMANDASPPPRLPQPATIILKDFLQPSYAQTQPSLMQTTTFSATRSGGPPSSSAMDRMERRIAQSWGNPYVRKQLMRQRAEQAAAAEQQQQQQHAATGQEMTSFGSLPQHGVQIGGVPTLPNTPSPYQGEFKVQRNAHTNGAGQNALRSSTENGYVAFGSATTNPIQFTPSQPRLARSLSPTTPSMAGLGGGQNTSPRAPHGDAQRRSRVSVYHPGHHSTMTLNETSERSRGSRVFGSTATVASANSALGEGEIAELADVRTLQLLQSLLRTFPAHTSSSKHSHGTHEAEAPLGVADVMQDDLIRETTRHSVQRLVQFLKAQTQEQQNLSRPSLLQKQ